MASDPSTLMPTTACADSEHPDPWWWSPTFAACIAQMHGAVRELEAGLEEISLSQQYANRGIYILCKVVGEMMKGAAPTHAGFELENYIKHPPTISGHAVPVRLPLAVAECSCP